MKLYPTRRPVPGEWVQSLDDPKVVVWIIGAHVVARRVLYNLRVQQPDGTRFDSISTRWFFPDKPMFQLWRCRSCEAFVFNGRCKCETSPSPWEPV